MTEYVLRKLVFMKHHKHDNVVGQVVPIDEIHQWVQQTLDKWNVSPMHSVKFLGSTLFFGSHWQQTNLKVGNDTVVSIYVEEWL